MGRRVKAESAKDPYIFGHPESWWEKESIGEGNGRRYSEKFRKAAVKAIFLRGEKPLKWVCEQLGISTAMYWLWRSEARDKPRAEGLKVLKQKRASKRGVSKLLGELV